MNKIMVGDNSGFHPKKKKKKNNVVITFDENARREFLTGFHKRKVERKQKAMEEFEKQLKTEKKRIKAQSKEAYKRLLMMQQPIPELGLQSEEIDMDTHSVSVTELSVAQLAKNNNWIGINEVRYQDQEAEVTENQSDNDELEGMELNCKKNGTKGQKHFSKFKDIKKEIKKQATIALKNSKIFQKKSQIERIKQIKRKKKEEKKRKKEKRKKMMGKQ